MNFAEFDEAMRSSEYKCQKLACNYSWLSVDTRCPTRCPLCGSCSITVVTGESLRRDMYNERFEPVLRTLPYRDREIIKLRYGFGDGFVYTQSECGKIFKLSSARICQIESRAIRKLGHPRRMEKLRAAGLIGTYAMATMPSRMKILVDRI